MIPVIAIAGRPNVGKSTLFNRLTKSRDALVYDYPGVTRDRQYGEGKLGEYPYIVIDTGGIGEQDIGISGEMASQAVQALYEADEIIFLVDGRAGLTAADELISQKLRELNKPVHLVVNKTDGIDEDVACADFYSLGLGVPQGIAASHGRGVTTLINDVLAKLPESKQLATDEAEEKQKGIRLAIIGKPNVGKSTLVNRILGEERVVVFDTPGTTRDSIFIPLERRGVHYVLIDTAGVRRRGKVADTLEKFSVIKTLQAIKEAHVVIHVIDAREGVSEQDLHLLGFVLDAGKSLLVAINKWDGLSEEQRETIKTDLDRRLGFVGFAKKHFISALHGTGVGDLFPTVQKAYRCAMQELSTPYLTELLEAAVKAHPPPLVKGRRIKMRYAHAGGHNPPIVVIHGTQTDSTPNSYRRYLANYYRDALKLVGTPIRIEFKSSKNPYAGRKNILTPRQQHKRKRLIERRKK